MWKSAKKNIEHGLFELKLFLYHSILRNIGTKCFDSPYIQQKEKNVAWSFSMLQWLSIPEFIVYKDLSIFKHFVQKRKASRDFWIISDTFVLFLECVSFSCNHFACNDCSDHRPFVDKVFTKNEIFLSKKFNNSQSLKRM